MLQASSASSSQQQVLPCALNHQLLPYLRHRVAYHDVCNKVVSLVNNCGRTPHATSCYGAGIGHVAKVEEFEVANVESLRLGRDADKIACTVDPAGYYWELLERHERNVTEALCKVLPHQLARCIFACIYSQENAFGLGVPF